MKFELITLSGVKLDQEIYSATIPTIDGEISVFPSHEPLVTMAKNGVIAVTSQKDGDEVEYFAISGGVVEITHERIRVLVDEADHGEDIIEAETKAALDRAIKLRDETDDQVEREKAQLGLFVTLVPPTQPMVSEAASAGFYESPAHGAFPKIQILTIEGLLDGREQPRYPDLARGGHTFRQAKREGGDGTQGQLFGGAQKQT